MNKKGFTLIELLAVIIILGILMLIAIPSVTNYINNSRKQSYVTSINEVIKGASTLVNSGEIEINDPNTTYYIPVSAINMENGTFQSPYGKIDEAYVVVTYDGDDYDYFFVGRDESSNGIPTITNEENIKNESIASNVDDISTDIGVGRRDTIVVFDNDLNVEIIKPSTKNVNGNTGEQLKEVEYPNGKTKETVSPGQIVKFNNEEFYVISRNGDDLVLLAKYNLKVGYKYNSENEIIGEFTPDEEGYGLQDSSLISCWNNDGNMAFSNTNYWNGKVGPGLKYDGVYAPTYTQEKNAYIFDSNSNLWNPVMNYKRYLESYGMDIKEARLITFNETHIIWDTFSYATYSNIFSTCFWTGTPSDHEYMRYVDEYSNYLFITKYSNKKGVKPVIVI